MRGRNQYDHVRRILFEIFFFRGFLECIDVGGSPKDRRGNEDVYRFSVIYFYHRIFS
jgi:hypothetical protein